MQWTNTYSPLESQKFIFTKFCSTFNARKEMNFKNAFLESVTTKISWNWKLREKWIAFFIIHIFRFKQHEQSTIKEFETFNGAVDEFFSQLESQKLDVKVAQQERQAMKKLDNIKKGNIILLCSVWWKFAPSLSIFTKKNKSKLYFYFSFCKQ